jgi:hypothetical protein
LLQKWPKNIPNVEDDAYETLVFTYNRELDLIELASSITISDVEKESSPPYLEDTMMDSKEETTNWRTPLQWLHHSSQWVPLN